MKWLVMPLLGAIFVVLLAGSVQSISADHLEPGPGIFLDENEVELVSYWTTESTTIQGSSYQVYLQTVLRNGDGQLINVTEITRTGAFVRHEITDYVFDTLMGEKEIITIDNIKYEKVQLSTSSDNTWLFDVYDHELIQTWDVEICGEPIKKYGYECANIFWTKTGLVFLEMYDVTTANWTILREMN